MTYEQGFAALLAILLLVPPLASLLGGRFNYDDEQRDHGDRRDGGE